MPDNPYQLNGAMPFQAGGNPFGQDIAGAYQSSYNSALAQNQALYGNILQGYNQTMQNQQQGQNSVQQRWDNLGGQVMNTIQGVDQSQRQAIQDVYAQQQGSMQQGMINRGLGNTTVMDSMSRGLTLDQTKANIALSNQMAQLKAGYQAQLGSAAAGYANQQVMQNTGEANQALGWMNTVQAQYPNAQSYGQLQYNQGLMNALNGRAGMSGAGMGGYGGGAAQQPIAPASAPRGANPFDYGYGGQASSVSGTPRNWAPPGAYGQTQGIGLSSQGGWSPGQQYAGTNQDYQTDPGSYSSDPYAGFDLSGGDYGDAFA